MKEKSQHLNSVRKACKGPLLRWFQAHKRVLPWRTRRTAYRVWVAEVMLQQTRVEQVDSYYRRFMKRFPSLTSLAGARQHDVLKLWEGLGYYGRARRMHDTARLLVSKHGARFPGSYEKLLELPGIGPYTAAAVASLAMNRDVAVVDGNVIRVLTRIFAMGKSTNRSESRRQLQKWADELMPPGKSALFNEAMMELGALCCVPRAPRCEECPLAKVCTAYDLKRQEDFPVKPAKRSRPHKIVGAGVVIKNGVILLAQRKENDMLGGLWEFPGGTQESDESIEQCIARELKEEMGINVSVGAHVVTVHHAYSHFTMELHAHLCHVVRGRPRAIECADWKWVKPQNLRAYAMSRADQIILDEVEKLDTLK